MELHDALERRPAPAVETAMYYTVAEALTIVDRYAGAAHASDRLSIVNGTLRLDGPPGGRSRVPVESS